MLVWRLVNGVLVVYLLLIGLRVMLFWFQRGATGRLWELLVGLTEPYLSVFRRLRFLQVRFGAGTLDLSPIAAILVLVMALDLVGGLQQFGRLTLGIFLAALAGALWSGLSFLMVLLLIVVIILILTFRRRSASPLIPAMAALVQPMVDFVAARVGRLLSPRRALGGMQVLLLTAALLGVLLIGGRALVALLRSALVRLPF